MGLPLYPCNAIDVVYRKKAVSERIHRQIRLFNDAKQPLYMGIPPPFQVLTTFLFPKMAISESTQVHKPHPSALSHPLILNPTSPHRNPPDTPTNAANSPASSGSVAIYSVSHRPSNDPSSVPDKTHPKHSASDSKTSQIHSPPPLLFSIHLHPSRIPYPHLP